MLVRGKEEEQKRLLIKQQRSYLRNSFQDKLEKKKVKDKYKLEKVLSFFLFKKSKNAVREKVKSAIRIPYSTMGVIPQESFSKLERKLKIRATTQRRCCRRRSSK